MTTGTQLSTCGATSFTISCLSVPNRSGYFWFLCSTLSRLMYTAGTPCVGAQVGRKRWGGGGGEFVQMPTLIVPYKEDIGS